ncbi:RNase H domain protein [Colletotrichum plurivorum]|uniref:ribonuclease H n=1 Tax=Colletotrichum plurivorum TaxID=2175906 RepID=A0A8H6K4K5_9PEZI|nr:RNase H domain protein [Colletotrichum plurivorum]
MAWPEIDHVELPDGRFITVCAPHHQVVCTRCCLDLSFDIESDDDVSDDESMPSLVSSGNHVDNVGYGADDDYVPSLVSSDNRNHNVNYGSRNNGPVGHESVMPMDRPLSPLVTGAGFFLKNFVPPSRVTGRVIPTRFGARFGTSVSPQELFPRRRTTRATPSVERFVHRHDASEFLIYTDGACFDNGAAHARGGCSFVFKPADARNENGGYAFRLEERGLDGETYRHTSNRAELRAVIAALRYRRWRDEGFKKLVIATDSTYVVNGATTWVRDWIRRGWRLALTEAPVKNRDLWEGLMLDIEKLHDEGLEVRFWRIPRRWNHDADRAAKGAAAVLDATDNFTDHFGILNR